MPPRDNAIKPITWIYITGAGLVLAVAIIFFTGVFSQQLGQLKPSTYFLILIPIGLVTAAFLFGALKSHAKYTGKAYGGTLELGGPVVVLVLIILLGYKFRPPQLETFDVTINLAAADNREPIEHGTIVCTYGSRTETKSIRDGQVVLSQVPVSQQGKIISLFPKVPGYQQQQQTQNIPPPDSTIQVMLQRIPDSVTVTGLVTGRNKKVIKNAEIIVSNGLFKTTTDEYGNFRFTIPVKDGTETALRVYVDRELKYDQLVMLSSGTPLNISVH